MAAEHHLVIPWARPEAVVLVLVVWTVARLRVGRSVAHPWFVGFALIGLCALLSDETAMLTGPAQALCWWLSGLVYFSGVAAIAEGIRVELGRVPLPPGTKRIVAAVIVALSAVCDLIPERRGELVGGIIGSAVLLYFVVPLLVRRRRQAGTWAIVAGLVVYAGGRSAVVAALSTPQAGPIHLAADVVAILVCGVGLILYGVEDEAGAAAVGGGPSPA